MSRTIRGRVRIARDGVSSESGRGYGLIGGTNAGGGNRWSQHAGGGAKLDEFELQFRRHPHPESGISPANAIRARRNRLFNMVGSDTCRVRSSRRASGRAATRTGGANYPLKQTLGRSCADINARLERIRGRFRLT